MTLNKLEAINISKTFKQRQGFFQWKEYQVLNDISITIKKGEITGLLGLNGAGKTTLIKILSSLLIPSKGQIKIDGINIEKDIQGYRRKINIISGGESSIYQRLSILENLQYFASLYSIHESEAMYRINDLLKRVGLFEDRDKKVETISKGMKQRLQIAKGLLNNPEYIFLDEPTIGLDVNISLEFRQLITHLSQERNIGVLLTSHYINEIEELCNKVYLLDDGKVIKEGTIEELKNQLRVEKKVIITFQTPSSNHIINSIPKSDIIDLREQSDIVTLGIRPEKVFDVLNYLRDKKCTNFEIVNKTENLEEALIKFERNKNHVIL